jgi:hypothetical protein
MAHRLATHLSLLQYGLSDTLGGANQAKRGRVSATECSNHPHNPHPHSFLAKIHTHQAWRSARQQALTALRSEETNVLTEREHAFDHAPAESVLLCSGSRVNAADTQVPRSTDGNSLKFVNCNFGFTHMCFLDLIGS